MNSFERGLFGRRKIYTVEENITPDNIVKVVNDALAVHAFNVTEEEYLLWYRRGMQPVLDRTKKIRPEICHRITVNNADMIVTFKNGYFLTKPATYVSRREDDAITEKVKQLNEYLYLSGKHEADNDVVDKFHTMSLGVIYLEPTGVKEDPCHVYSLDPRSAFVTYSLRPGSRPVMGVNVVVRNDSVYVDAITEGYVFHLYGRKLANDDEVQRGVNPGLSVESLISYEPNLIGKINMVEYCYNTSRMSAFENVLDIMDAYNEVESMRADGIDQFIQSLTLLYNCTVDDDVTANDIRERGLIELTSVGENRADVKILSEQLDQSQTQITLDNLYEQMLDKAGVPSSIRDGGSTSDNTGAVYLRSGWAMADTHARNTEDEFKKSNRYFDEVFLRILKLVCGFELSISDFELKMSRNNSSNLIAKTQAAMNMKELGFAPAIAFERSELSDDPLTDVEMSKQYIDTKWGAEVTEQRMPIENSQNAQNEVLSDESTNPTT